jgi:ferritin
MLEEDHQAIEETKMINPAMQDALNAQINAEQYSAQLYLAMSGHCAASSYQGFAHWLLVQASEETAHAMKLVRYLLDRGGRIVLQPIAAPPTDFGGVVSLFEKVLEHEKNVTKKISDLFETARREKDYASEIALQWFVTEQVEEEANVSQVVDRLKAVGDKGGAIWYLDKELGKRAAGA